jgi:hypothetical protein
MLELPFVAEKLKGLKKKERQDVCHALFAFVLQACWTTHIFFTVRGCRRGLAELAC